MDARRFDDVSKFFATSTSRRTALKALAGSALGAVGLVGLAGGAGAADGNGARCPNGKDESCPSVNGKGCTCGPNKTCFRCPQGYIPTVSGQCRCGIRKRTCNQRQGEYAKPIVCE